MFQNATCLKIQCQASQVDALKVFLVVRKFDPSSNPADAYVFCKMLIGREPWFSGYVRMSCSKGREFKSWYCILDGHFFTYVML